MHSRHMGTRLGGLFFLGSLWKLPKGMTISPRWKFNFKWVSLETRACLSTVHQTGLAFPIIASSKPQELQKKEGA